MAALCDDMIYRNVHRSARERSSKSLLKHRSRTCPIESNLCQAVSRYPSFASGWAVPWEALVPLLPVSDASG